MKKNKQPNIRTETLRRRYLWKDEQGKVIETEEQMFRRVANTIATAESKHGALKKQVKDYAERFYRLMISLRFLPNSPTLMNANRRGLLSACFVIPVEDSIEGIFEAIKQTALIQKAGGGTGFSFDRLRPTGDRVTSSGGITSGPISFWHVFSQASNAIQQGAHRRGANMSMMSISHPDILKFIHAKRDLAALTNFNISVKVTKSWMKKLNSEPDALQVVTNPRTQKRYVLPHSINVDSYTIDNLVPEGQTSDNCYTIKEIWDMIVKNAHATGEPGICYIDHVNRDNPTPHLGQIEATNPCGEQPLLPYEACNLGSINISTFVSQNNMDLNWGALKKTIKLAVRFLDNVIDVNYYPVPKIKEVALGNRKIGLGIMGFADTLILLSIIYGSEEAAEFVEKLASFIQEHAHQASEELAKERGCFPNWKGSIWEKKYHRPMRNAACTTIAPTGTISIIADCNGGIEPIFKIVTQRRALEGEEFTQLNALVERLGTEQGWLTDKVHDLLCQGVPPREIPQIPKNLAEVIVTAHEIAPEWHVRIQAAFQKYTDNAVSKTVNLPSTATVEDVDKDFRLAYELGCKGTTVYRDESRENQVITAANKIAKPAEKPMQLRPRVRMTSGSTTKFRMGCGTLFVTVNKDESGLCEVFSNLGKAGGCPAQSEATCRAVSVALRCGVKPEILIEQLKGIRCLSAISRKKDNKDINVLSCPDAIARALEEALGSNCEPKIVSSINNVLSAAIPCEGIQDVISVIDVVMINAADGIIFNIEGIRSQ